MTPQQNGSQSAFGFVDNRSASYEDNEVHYGLTKREYFAAMALQGMLASCDPEKNPWLDANTAAKEAVGYADALLTQLNSSK